MEPCHDETVFEIPHRFPRCHRLRCLPRLFTQLSFNAGVRAVLARFRRLILVRRPIYRHLHVAQRDGDSVCFPFYAATSFVAVKSAQATTSTTVSVQRNGEKLCLTVWYIRRRHSLPDRDRFESQQLIK